MKPDAEILAMVRSVADAHALDPALVCAVIEQESAWNPNAIRYESGFRARYVAPLNLPATEEVARSISWGLMQVMGQVARERGYSEEFLSGLCDAATGVRVGCSVLAAKLEEAARELAKTPVAAVLANGATAGKSSLCISACRTATIGCVTISPPQVTQKRNDGISDGHAVTASDGALAVDAMTERALQLWNGGGNPDYSRQVIARLPRYR